MDIKTTDECKKADLKQVFDGLCSSEKGLTNDEVEKRVEEFGFNEVEQEKKSAIVDFVSRFWNPISWFLEATILITFFIQEYFDMFILLAILLVNVGIGFYNEHDSQKALELLKKQLTIKTKVMRNGKWEEKEARDLVVGDILMLGLGDVVPADVKIISGTISSDQSAVTGESLPVECKESDVLFTSSTVKRGEAKCVVVNTGMHTYYGKTVELVNIAKPKSKQEAIMFKVSRNLIYVGMVAFAIVVIYSLIIGIPLQTILIFAVLFIAGGIPVALPAMFTISQAKGATDLSKDGVLVTKLDAIENAASVEILCLDKTGTITLNELSVSDAVPFGKLESKELLTFSMLASSAESKDIIDNTILSYAKEQGANTQGYVQEAYTPFEPATKRAEGTVKQNDKKFLVTKGATQTILSLCKNLKKSDLETINTTINKLSEKGCRVLGVAKSDSLHSDEFHFMGLIGLSNPLRPDSKETISALKDAGIRPMMLTGDNLAVAKEIAQQAGIGSHIVRISEIKELPKDKQAKALQQCDGIAEIYPEDKYWVVKEFQNMGLTVGMTGDGVNDAPALKQSELGIAVNNSTDVAKAAASLVLTKPGIKVILEGIRTSRETYQRMLTWTLRKIACSIQFMMIISVGFFWFHNVVVLITGLMLLIIINDFMTMSLAVDHARSTASPNSWNVKNITIAAAFMGVLFFIIELIILVISANYLHLNFDQIRTVVLLSLVYTAQFAIIIIRERGHFYSSYPSALVSILVAIAILGFTFISIFGIILTPVSATIVISIMAICILYVLAIDFAKVAVFKKLDIR